MGNGHLTEDELKKGLQSVGSFQSLAGTPPRRDRPTRPTVDTTNDNQEHQSTEHQQARRALQVVSKETKIAPASIASPTESTGTPTTVDKSRKADLYPERKTLPISVEMRDAAIELARVLKLHRTDKSERITDNTVFRCFIRFGLENFAIAPDDIVNTEDDLMKLLRRKNPVQNR